MLSDRLMALLRNPETPTYALRDAVAEEEGTVASVWVVVGETSDFSDKITWTVTAYLEESQAEACCKRLNDWCKANGCQNRGKSVLPPTKPVDDPNFCCDPYTGTSYAIEQVVLRVEEGA